MRVAPGVYGILFRDAVDLMNDWTLQQHGVADDKVPADLTRPFWLIVFDWDGTAVANRQEDTGALRRELEKLLRCGVSIVVITGANFPDIDRQFTAALNDPHKRNLYVLANRGSEVYGFANDSRPVLVWQRLATDEENQRLTEIADASRNKLATKTGLDIRVIYDRMNRRRIDLIPEWSDPPKPALGDLFQAVQTRLKRAGLRGGLREAIMLVAKIARAKGLPHARITSDAKHIEIGLTDKGDAIDWVMHELAQPRNLSPEKVLIAGDEFGSPGGIEGSDHKMMTASSRGAVVVSVGPEPAGVPDGVLNLGGGPARFRALLRAQFTVHEQLEQPASATVLSRKTFIGLPADVSSDPDWLLVEKGFSAAREDEIESLFTTANGAIGTRGSLPEGSKFSFPLTLIAGVFGIPEGDTIPELVPVPDWTHLAVGVEGRKVTLEEQGTLVHRRVLDVKQGLLWREWRYCDLAGRATHLRYLRLASLADRHVLLQSAIVSAENYSGHLQVESRLEHPAPGASIVLVSESTPIVRGASMIDVRVAEYCARGGETKIALAIANQLADAEGKHYTPEFKTGQDFSVLQWEFELEVGGSCSLDRLVYASTSRHVSQPPERASRQLDEILTYGSVKEVVAAHTRAWEERWQGADVKVEGDPEAQRALRFALYHLISAANPEDERVSVGARGLTGSCYKGHVFWDTEIFLLPFYIFTHPPSARALLMYRFHTLPAAREKACALGYRGALFAWESADDGRETTPPAVLAPDGTVVRILSGEQEHHISADIAYAVWNYWQGSGDDEFMFTAGAELLIETARFWASRAHLGPDELYHIDKVIGPDEYHETVDDNAYTNVMAQWNLERGAEAAQLIQERRPAQWPDLSARLQLAPTETEEWLTIARKMYTGFDPRTGLFEQFRGYFELEFIDVAAFEPRSAPMDVLLGRERTQRSQVIKQADVVMFLALLWDRFPPEVREANFRYYEPRTAHGSSLSPSVHALVAARLGDIPLAEKYFRQTASIDLADTMGNAAGGVHIAAMGGLWQAAILGFAGMKSQAGGLTFTPRLAHHWQHLSFPVRWRGRDLLVTLNGLTRSLDVHLAGKEDMAVAVEDGPSVTLAPGQRFRITKETTGWGAWQEVGDEFS